MQLAVLGGHTDIVQELADKFPSSVKFVTQVNSFSYSVSITTKHN